MLSPYGAISDTRDKGFPSYSPKAGRRALCHGARCYSHDKLHVMKAVTTVTPPFAIYKYFDATFYINFFFLFAIPNRILKLRGALRCEAICEVL
jgi:hypothetical protein